MLTFLARRILLLAPILIGVSMVSFLMVHLVLQRYLSPEAVLTTWKQACNRSV